MLLEAQNIRKRFGGLVAVNNVSLSVAEGQIVGLIGPNGAGKTTLLNLIAGALKPESGCIRYRGEDITGLRPDGVCRMGISRTFQISRPFPGMTVRENVKVAAVFGGGHRDHEPTDSRVLTALRFVELPVSPETVADRLNTVQLKRLDLARALVSSPGLLLLDEMAAGLTPAELVDLIKLIRRIRDRGVSIIVVEHLMRMIMEICDRIAVLHFGEKIAEGPPVEIAQNQLVTEAYLGDKYFL